jgi:hypothetical protein
MKLHKVLILISLSLTAPSAFAQGNGPTSAMTASPAIPEEARRHFVMGTTLFKDAKSADDFLSVESEFKQAVDLAPQWPDARYNLALAKEAAGDYAGAMEDLKLYQQFKLPESDARTAQDKIYVLEAKQNKVNAAVKTAAVAANATPVIERYECSTPQNERTVSQNFAFNFSSHTVTWTIVWEHSRDDSDEPFEESGQLLVMRSGCGYANRPLGCAAINRATSRLSIYAWGPNGGEDQPRGVHQPGGPYTVEYSCHAAK